MSLLSIHDHFCTVTAGSTFLAAIRTSMSTNPYLFVIWVIMYGTFVTSIALPPCLLINFTVLFSTYSSKTVV